MTIRFWIIWAAVVLSIMALVGYMDWSANSVPCSELTTIPDRCIGY